MNEWMIERCFFVIACDTKRFYRFVLWHDSVMKWIDFLWHASENDCFFLMMFLDLMHKRTRLCPDGCLTHTMHNKWHTTNDKLKLKQRGHCHCLRFSTIKRAILLRDKQRHLLFLTQTPIFSSSSGRFNDDAIEHGLLNH